MGIKNEKSDTSIIMDENMFNGSIEPIILKKEKVYAEPLDRDPNDTNAHLKLGFEDVITELRSIQSFDRVWIGSHAVFELVKYIFYRLLTTLLAISMAFLLGLVFRVLSCIHIWVVIPVIQSLMMAIPSVRAVWRSLVDTFIMPLFYSIGKSLDSVHVKTTQN